MNIGKLVWTIFPASNLSRFSVEAQSNSLRLGGLENIVALLSSSTPNSGKSPFLKFWQFFKLLRILCGLGHPSPTKTDLAPGLYWINNRTVSCRASHSMQIKWLNVHIGTKWEIRSSIPHTHTPGRARNALLQVLRSLSNASSHPLSQFSRTDPAFVPRLFCLSLFFYRTHTYKFVRPV